VITPPKNPGNCCKQSTITIKHDQALKYYQRIPFGTEAWEEVYALRTAVEGTFGNLKNPATENISRGFIREARLPRVNLAMALAAVSYNIRAQLTWAKRHDITLMSPLFNHASPDDHRRVFLPRNEDELMAYIEVADRFEQQAA